MKFRYSNRKDIYIVAKVLNRTVLFNNKLFSYTLSYSRKYALEHPTERELRDFCNEIHIMSKIGDHPNVVSLIGACTINGRYFTINGRYYLK